MTTVTSENQRQRSALVADPLAGLVVFLVALPLCLGIAIASNAPPIAGLIAGIVGGLIVGAISGSHTSVSGPAAGLTAVVAAQIASLGSFEALLMATTLAGAMQVALGIARAGSIAAFVPSSVIKGLLAAIGLILIMKQFPYLLGYLAEKGAPAAAEGNFIQQLVKSVTSLTHRGAAVIGIVSVVLLVVWDKVPLLKRLPIPPALVVVLFGVATQQVFGRLGQPWAMDANRLVDVPIADSWSGLISFLKFPDPTSLGESKLYVAAVTIALVASLETLLNVEAVDKLDPEKRVSPANRELIAQGAGNLITGMIGGLPVTSVIVRSSVNISAGGRTKASAIIHGVLLLLCVVFLPTWLNQIPLSCLAAILITTGFKLAKPKLFVQMWREGLNQFIPFFVTVSAIVATDLLKGILIGLGVSILFILRSNLRRPLHRIVERHIGDEVIRIELANQVSFFNRVAINAALQSVPRNGHVMIDARSTDYIDSDVHELIEEFLREVAPVRGIRVSLIGFKEHYEQLEDRVEYVDYTTRELQASLTPDNVLELLQEGNARFRENRPLSRDLMRQLQVTADRLHPLAVVFSGSSSRTPVELIFDAGAGDIFCARVTGNAVDAAVLASLEYACCASGAKLITVLGHGNNQITRMAIESSRESLSREPSARESSPSATGAANHDGCDHLDALLQELRESVQPRHLAGWDELDDAARIARIDEVSRAHLKRMIEKILRQSPPLKSRVERGEIKIVGAFYDVRTGQVDFFS